MKIYIDHFSEQSKIQQKLRKLLESQIPNIQINSVDDCKEEEDPIEMESEYIDKADVIIPIITSSYLADNIEQTEIGLSKASQNKDQIIIPLIYEEANWSSKNWLVKSKVFPDSGLSYSSLNSREQNKVLNKLVEAILNINNVKQKSLVDSPISSSYKDIDNTIFISHSHTDADFGELLKLKLEKTGIECWVDAERLTLGQDWREEIDKGIETCKALIVIMSPEARKSEYVTYEWSYAWGKGKQVLPIMLEQTSLHPRLESLQYLDFTNRVSRPYEKLIERINKIKN